MSKILIIDDDPIIMKVLAGKLTEQGHQVLTAATGQEGLDKFRAAHPMLVILDWHLPDHDGDWVLDALRKDAAGKNTAVAVFTSDTSPNVMESALRSQSVRVLPKKLLPVAEIAARIDEMAKAISGPQA